VLWFREPLPWPAPLGILRDYKEVRMARLVAAAPLDFCQALLEIYTVNDRINQILLEHLDPHAWRAKPPGGRGRTIAAIFAHMHNIRRKWLRLSATFQMAPSQTHVTFSGLGMDFQNQQSPTGSVASAAFLHSLALRSRTDRQSAASLTCSATHLR